jgi:hypothetical protein
MPNGDTYIEEPYSRQQHAKWLLVIIKSFILADLVIIIGL